MPAAAALHAEHVVILPAITDLDCCLNTSAAQNSSWSTTCRACQAWARKWALQFSAYSSIFAVLWLIAASFSIAEILSRQLQQCSASCAVGSARSAVTWGEQDTTWSRPAADNAMYQAGQIKTAGHGHQKCTYCGRCLMSRSFPCCREYFLCC